MTDHTADYSKHTDEELQRGIEKAVQNEPRIAAEDSDEAVEAQRTQREAMAAELERRRAQSREPTRTEGMS